MEGRASEPGEEEDEDQSREGRGQAEHGREAARGSGITSYSIHYTKLYEASEVVALKVGDIDSQRMTLRIEQGKGRKDRYAMLS